MSLELNILSKNDVKSVRFPPDLCVEEALDLLEMTGRNFGLLLPADDEANRQRVWLKPEHTLQHYNLQSGATLELKRKRRPLKIKLMDDSRVTMLVEYSLPVSQVVNSIGEKLDIREPQFFGLAFCREDNKNFLNKGKDLEENGVLDDEILVFKRHYDSGFLQRNLAEEELDYAEMQKQVVQGHHILSKEEALHSGALQLQILFGDWNPTQHTIGFISGKLDEILPKQFTKKITPKELMNEWKKLVRLTRNNAIFRFIQLVRCLDSYEMTFFDVLWKPVPEGKREPARLGISQRGFIIVNQNGQICEERALSQLKRWAANPKHIILDFGGHRSEYLSLQTEESRKVADKIAAVIDDLLIKQRGKKGSGVTAISGISLELSMEIRQVKSLKELATVLTQLEEALQSPLLPQQSELSVKQRKKELKKYNDMLEETTGSLIGTAFLTVKKKKLDCHAGSIALHLAQLIGAARQVAFITSGGDSGVLDSARACVGAVRSLVDACCSVVSHPNNSDFLKAISTAAMMLRITSVALLATARGALADDVSGSLVVECARVVFVTTNDLLVCSRMVVASCDCPDDINKYQEIVERANEKVPIIANAVAVAITDKICKSQLVSVCQTLLDDSVLLLQGAEAQCQDPKIMGELSNAAKMASLAIQLAINACMGASSKAGTMEMSLRMVQDAVAQVMVSGDNTKALLSSAKAVEMATSHLIEAAKSIASMSQKELTYFTGVEQAVNSMMQAAQGDANNFRTEAEKVVNVTKMLAQDLETEEKEITAIRNSCKATAATTCGLLATIKEKFQFIAPEILVRILNLWTTAFQATADLVGAVTDSFQNQKNDVQFLLLFATAAAESSSSLIAEIFSDIDVFGESLGVPLKVAATKVEQAIEQMSAIMQTKRGDSSTDK